MRVTLTAASARASAHLSEIHAAMLHLAASGEVESLDVDGKPMVIERADLHHGSSHHEHNVAGDRHSATLTVHLKSAPQP